MDKIRLLLVDDHALLRQGVISTLSKHDDMEVVAEAGDATTALEKAHAFLPDIVLLDVNLPDRSGVDILADFRKDLPFCKVVMLTVSDDHDTLFKALMDGASGYILKGVSAEELVRAVRSVHAGETYVTAAVAGHLLAELTREQRDSHDQPVPLTDRERGILELVAQGQTNKEIAVTLYLSEKTVKHYMTNILQKLQVRNRVEAALKAREFMSS
jgi:two-component system nitrate/nitrite response regulator NarL